MKKNLKNNFPRKSSFNMEYFSTQNNVTNSFQINRNLLSNFFERSLKNLIDKKHVY
jgi:hypothetical protein